VEWLTVGELGWLVTALAPQLGGDTVAAGPARVLAIGVACGCALIAGRRWRAELDAGGWSSRILQELLWWAAVALALRCVFEPVMVAYYTWPALAVALIAASPNWPRLIATSVAAVALTYASQLMWRSPWTYWAPMIAGLALILFLARIPPSTWASQVSPPGGDSPPGTSVVGQEVH